MATHCSPLLKSWHIVVSASSVATVCGHTQSFLQVISPAGDLEKWLTYMLFLGRYTVYLMATMGLTTLTGLQRSASVWVTSGIILNSGCRKRLIYKWSMTFKLWRVHQNFNFNYTEFALPKVSPCCNFYMSFVHIMTKISSHYHDWALVPCFCNLSMTVLNAGVQIATLSSLRSQS